MEIYSDYRLTRSHIVKTYLGRGEHNGLISEWLETDCGRIVEHFGDCILINPPKFLLNRPMCQRCK